MVLAGGPFPAAHRWRAVAALLAAEFLGLSIFVDLPTDGPARELTAAARLLIPVVIGGAAAALLISRDPGRRALDAIPAWEGGAGPWIALGAHGIAFAATAHLGVRLMGAGAPPLERLPFGVWIASAAVSVALALVAAVPPAALGEHVLRRLAVPLLAGAAGLLGWRAVSAATALWDTLRAATLHGAAALLRLLSSGPLVLDPEASLIGLRGFTVEVAPACSGVDGLGLVLVFQALWLSLARARIRALRAALVLVPLGAVAALAANVVRIATLVAVGASGREALALGAFHSKLGWILFLALAFALVAAAEHVPWLSRGPGAAGGGLPEDAAAHVAPLVAALATALVAGLFGGAGVDPGYGARIVAAVAVLWLVRRELPAPAVSFSWPPVALALAVAVPWIAWGGGPPSALGAALEAASPAARAGWIAVRLLGAVVVIPVVEELAFRGFLLPWLATRGAPGAGPRGPLPWTAILASSAAFGALHPSFVLGTFAGVAFALARQWRGRLGDAVLAHALCNGVIAAAVLLAGRWDLWG